MHGASSFVRHSSNLHGTGLHGGSAGRTFFGIPARTAVFLCIAVACFFTLELVCLVHLRGNWSTAESELARYEGMMVPEEKSKTEWCGSEWVQYNYSAHDMVLPIDRPNCITPIVIENAIRFWNFRRLIFIINDETNCPALLNLASEEGRKRMKCIDRNKVIPGVTLDRLRDLPTAVRGWIFQQLTKFGAAMHFSNLSPLFLVWDSDLIPLRPIPLFGYIPSMQQPRGTFFAGHRRSHNEEAKRAYHGMYYKLTGYKLIDPPGGSWINGWQVWYRPYVAEMLEHITSVAGRSSDQWAQTIIDTIVFETQMNKINMRNSFSEFDSYGSWVWTQHPQHVDFWHQSGELWVRYPEALQNGECCPTYETLCSMAKTYTYACWENHKFGASCPAHVIYPASERSDRSTAFLSRDILDDM